MTAQKKVRMRVLMVLAMALLAVSLLFSACANKINNNGNSSNVPTQQSTTTSNSDGSLQSINQDIQSSVQGIDGAQTDVAGADATSTTENGNDPQP